LTAGVTCMYYSPITRQDDLLDKVAFYELYLKCEPAICFKLVKPPVNVSDVSPSLSSDSRSR